jgi:hypothetical protein
MTTHRQCGDCQLCCWVLPTEEIGKGANCRCKHQRAGRGCAIHSHKPMSCSLWNCRWLVNDDTDDQPRPDRSGIVLDIIPDVLRMTFNDAEPQTVPAIVAWVDPRRRDAYKTEAFKRYVARQTVPVLVRFSATEGTVLLPPKLTGRDDIIEHESSLGSDMPTTLAEKAAAIGGLLETPHPAEPFGKATLTMPDGRKVEVGARWKFE